jgi:hypothetical protein
MISATVYLFNHIYRLDDGMDTYLYLFSLGVLFAIPLVMTRRLWFTCGLHWAGNVTFYYTHEILKTEEGSRGLSPNLVLVGVVLLMILLNYFVLHKFKLVDTEREGKPALPY